MDYALQVHQAKYVFPTPDGLKELSSDIIREVLRHQPEHINGFIADYLETMLVVREHARSSAVVVCDVFRQGYLFDELYKLKNVNREQINHLAVIIQAAWRGYMVRKKIKEWLKKKKKFEDERQKKISMKIEEVLTDLGITYAEATRAAGAIQTAFKETKRGKWVSGNFGEFWLDETIPFGQRLREEDRAQGRFDRWEKEDFDEFFELDEAGSIKYIWPKVGQLQMVLRDEIPNDADIVEFFGARDLQGIEQYSYLIKPRANMEIRGVPIGFLIPLPKTGVQDSGPEVEFINPENVYRMGNYTYIFRDDVSRTELEKFDELLKTQAETFKNGTEMLGEFDYDPQWVLPRALIRIKKEFLKKTDDEVRFVSLPNVVCEQENYAFKAETLQQTSKVIRHILRNKSLNVEEGLLEASNMAPYKSRQTGRIFPVDAFTFPKYVQKIEIMPETGTGEDEATDAANYAYIFVPMTESLKKKIGETDSLIKIPISRFQGYHTDYKGSEGLTNQVFIMGPKITTPDGKPFTFESLFWDEYGQEAWYQLLYKIYAHEDIDEEADTEVEADEEEKKVEKVPDRVRIKVAYEEETEVEYPGEEFSVDKGSTTKMVDTPVTEEPALQGTKSDLSPTEIPPEESETEKAQEEEEEGEETKQDLSPGDYSVEDKEKEKEKEPDVISESNVDDI